VAIVRSETFTSGIVAAGMAGFGLALTFLFNGAPDLAFTQFSVEALSIVLLLAIIGRMPFQELDGRSRSQRRRDAFVAIALGLVVTAVLMSVIAGPFDAGISDYFRQVSVTQAHGRNLVNVIIVDFRALDTLGEITVLALAALAASALVVTTSQRKEGAAAQAAKEQA
jgi:multicomponent Na+:H+ antiporter subunit A